MEALKIFLRSGENPADGMVSGVAYGHEQVAKKVICHAELVEASAARFIRRRVGLETGR